MSAETEAEAVEFIRSLVSAWHCCGTCAGSILGQRDQRVWAEAWDEGYHEGYHDTGGPNPYRKES